MRAIQIISLGLAASFSAANAHADLDTLSLARIAAVEGRHAECAELADKARRQPNAVWHAHHVYATCQIFATEARRGTLTGAEYSKAINKAREALQLLVRTPGLLATEEQRASVEFVMEELDKRIEAFEKP
ncbi:MAG: hypothetical protein KJ622_00660 [Alphaproteobacteria bacterium]|nr:hypothetical protein [Alphaproteobacteria bacterium]